MTILDRIIEVKKKEVQEMKNMNCVHSNSQYKKRSFIQLLEHKSDIAVIAEFKRASPSKGDINQTSNPIVQSNAYSKLGADAISVLTDSTFFKGSFADLQVIRDTVNCPILCKDFIIDTVQIDVAKSNGANIILLIAAALDRENFHELYQYARENDLEVLMEVHNEQEVEIALETDNLLIGVNNRNLKTFEVDLSVTEQLSPLIKQEGRFIISESGIKTKEDVERVIRAGGNGILVGETLMKHDNLEQALKEFKLPLKEGLYK